MKIISIGSDRKLFDENSEVRQRIVDYGGLVQELHVIVFNRGSESKNQNFVNVYLHPTNSKSRWLYVFDAVKIGRKLASQDTQWLITAQDPFESGLVGWLIAKKNKIPLQLQVHTDFLSPYFKKESLLNRIRVLIAKFLIPRADCIRVVSERIKKSLLRVTRYPLRATVLPIFVDVKKIQLASVKIDLQKKYPQFDFIILMASRLTREKNISLAIEAMKEIIKKYPKTGLIITGDGLDRKTLELQTAKNNLQNNIIMDGWTDDLASYYKTADLFLLTSNYEGYGMAVVEAMAAGCPIIMTDVGLAGEILIDKKDGLVVPVGNKEKLIEAIQTLIENVGLRSRLIENAAKTLNFWPTKAQYLKSYRDIWRLCGQK